MASSPYTAAAVDFVSRNPGCCKYDLAAHLARRCCPSKLYYLVNTQIRLGNLVALRRGNRYALYTVEQYRAAGQVAESVSDDARQDGVTGRELTVAELARHTEGLRATLGLPADVSDTAVRDVAAESGLITVVNA